MRAEPFSTRGGIAKGTAECPDLVSCAWQRTSDVSLAAPQVLSGDGSSLAPVAAKIHYRNDTAAHADLRQLAPVELELVRAGLDQIAALPWLAIRRDSEAVKQVSSATSASARLK